jgi:hypothetical protein
MPTRLPQRTSRCWWRANGVKDNCTNIRDWQNIPYRVTKNKRVFVTYFDKILSSLCFILILSDVEM